MSFITSIIYILPVHLSERTLIECPVVTQQKGKNRVTFSSKQWKLPVCKRFLIFSGTLTHTQDEGSTFKRIKAVPGVFVRHAPVCSKHLVLMKKQTLDDLSQFAIINLWRFCLIYLFILCHVWLSVVIYFSGVPASPETPLFSCISFCDFRFPRKTFNSPQNNKVSLCCIGVGEESNNKKRTQDFLYDKTRSKGEAAVSWLSYLRLSLLPFSLNDSSTVMDNAEM